MASSFSALLRQLRKAKYKTIQEFADALGIAPSRLSRSMRGGLPFDINGCLNLARVTGVSPDKVLRAAGKHRTADLIREVYGLDDQTATSAPLSESALTIARLYDAIDPRWAEIQRAVEAMLQLVNAEQAAGKGDTSAVTKMFISMRAREATSPASTTPPALTPDARRHEHGDDRPERYRRDA